MSGEKKGEKQESEAGRQASIYNLLAKLAEALINGVVELYNVEIEADELTLILPETVAAPSQIPIPVVVPPPKQIVEAKPE
ncbi:MAG: hypothetical protein QXJ56_07370, partial [Ignisphaera sp.]